MNQTNKRRLLVVSNRLPFTLHGKNTNLSVKESDGGLVSALKSYFESEPGTGLFDSVLWIGAAEFNEGMWLSFKEKQIPLAYAVQPLFIEKKTYGKYYNGFCNATLWPLFHYFPSFVEFDSDTFTRYEEVNQQFADEVIACVRPGDTIWIHDYQLMLVPGMIRDKCPDVPIGFFLHIPFPSFEIFRLMHRTWKEKILTGLLGADLIGFHTHEYVQHFLKTVQMTKGYDHQFRSIVTPRGTVKAEMFPIGIDFKKFNQAIRNPKVIQQKNSILNNFPGKKIIFSVDRLDYTKGITHRLSGFEHFLDKNPTWLGKIVFVLVVVPSRQIVSKYNERKKLIEEEIGRINGKYSTLRWQPIIYRYCQLKFHELTALYHASDVGLLTPLRDGMNLVAKEYIASRENQGVLILSELAGAANELSEAILVNPLDRNEVAQAIKLAIDMTPAEQESKIELMQARLQEYSVVQWMNDFLRQLEETKSMQQSHRAKYLSSSTMSALVNAFKASEKKLLLLDYDGTLVPYFRHPQLAVPSDGLIHLLSTLANDQSTDVTLISGRDSRTLEHWFGDMSLNLVSEHGAGIRAKHGAWVFNPSPDQNWKQNIRPVLELFAQRSPGSFIEEKDHTLVWHYRNVDAELGFVRSRELIDNLNHLIYNAPLQVVDGNKVIEIRTAGIDKGAITARMIEQTRYDFILAMGDDKTDEDIFRTLGDFAYTIKIGSGHTLAKYHMTDHREALQLLSQFANEQA